ncbi:MAG: site-specific integrase [Rhodocyclaceae bacterium]|nr:site-specific integrase [Rhodocyclaceae bacterium]
MPYKRSGTRKWWIVVKGVRQSSGTEDYEDAAALENRLNLEVWKQQHMGVKPPKSWKEAVVKYLKERQHKPSYDTIVQRLGWWSPYLKGIHDLRNITRDMIDQILTRHRTVTALPSSDNTTANKYAGCVGAVLTAACREWGWIESTPKLRKYPEPDHRRNWLSVEEWRKLEKELPAHLLLPARFALATGLRAGKVFGLEWNHVDMKHRSMTFTGNAIKRGNTIPLNQTAMNVLDEAKRQGTVHLQRVFMYEGEPLQDYGLAWYKAMERAGLGKLTLTKEGWKTKRAWEGEFNWHGLRHTFASWLGQNGTPETALDQLCGWAEKDTRSIYTHLNVETLRPYSEIIDKLLGTKSAQSKKKLVKANL